MLFRSKLLQFHGKPISQNLVEKTTKLNDYLRYCFFDKYFKKIGCQDVNSGGNGYNSAHYLISWYYGWGGDVGGNWAWRIGGSHVHFGYQNVMAGYAAKTLPMSRQAQIDWNTSLQRQIELYKWLQSEEGAISGGCTNSLNGRYEKYPAGWPTFYGMA